MKRKIGNPVRCQSISFDGSGLFTTTGNKLVSQIISRNKIVCGTTNDMKTISCILLNISKNNGITLQLSDYDEGQKYISDLILVDELSIGALIETRNWRESQQDQYITKKLGMAAKDNMKKPLYTFQTADFYCAS